MDHPAAIRTPNRPDHSNFDPQLGQRTRGDCRASTNLLVIPACERFFPEFRKGVEFAENMIYEKLANHDYFRFLQRRHRGSGSLMKGSILCATGGPIIGQVIASRSQRTMKLTILSVAYPLTEVGPDAVGGSEQILTVQD